MMTTKATEKTGSETPTMTEGSMERPAELAAGSGNIAMEMAATSPEVNETGPTAGAPEAEALPPAPEDARTPDADRGEIQATLIGPFNLKSLLSQDLPRPKPDPERVARLIASMNDHRTIRFRPLDRVEWIEGLKNSDLLEYGEKAVVVRHLEDDNLDAKGAPRDLELGFIATRELPAESGEDPESGTDEETEATKPPRTEEFFYTALFDSRRFRHA